MIDNRVVEAIRGSVEQCGQEAGLSDKIIALVASLADGNVTLDEIDTIIRHISLLFDETTVSEADLARELEEE